MQWKSLSREEKSVARIGLFQVGWVFQGQLAMLMQKFEKLGETLMW